MLPAGRIRHRQREPRRHRRIDRVAAGAHDVGAHLRSECRARRDHAVRAVHRLRACRTRRTAARRRRQNRPANGLCYTCNSLHHWKDSDSDGWLRLFLAGNSLRRIALDAQGLTRVGAVRRGVDAAHRALEQLGYVQIDTISIVARAHHHTFWNRVPNYRPAHLDRLVSERRAFEYWFHAAPLPADARLSLCAAAHARAAARANSTGSARTTQADARGARPHPRRRAAARARLRNAERPQPGLVGLEAGKTRARAAVHARRSDVPPAARAFRRCTTCPSACCRRASTPPRRPSRNSPAPARHRSCARTASRVQRQITYLRPGTSIRAALRARLEADVTTASSCA